MVNWSDAQVTEFFNEYRWLSNFWPCKVVFEGVAYPSSEHAYQAAKTLDPKERNEVLSCDTPGKAKRVGKKVTIRSDWYQIKLPTMRQIVTEKFKDPELRAKLLATGTQTLVEGNQWGDTFWGASWDRDHKALYGENWLGRILMSIRENIRRSTMSSAKGWRIRRSQKIDEKGQSVIMFWCREDSAWAMQGIGATCYAIREEAETDAFFLATKHPDSNIDIAEW